MIAVPAPMQDWVSISLGILVEATPFLLLGVLISAVAHVFIREEVVLRLIPRNRLLALVPAVLLGFAMPVCECGNVAVARRLLAKGVPLGTGLTFLLAAPVLNPVALFATWAAFRNDAWMVAARAGLTLLVAFAVAALLERWGGSENLFAGTQLKLSAEQPERHTHDHPQKLSSRLGMVVDETGREFLGMMQVLVIGASLAAATQVLVPRDALTGFGSGIVFSILAMMTLAFVLSICSTVDAFFAASYASLFPLPALLAFLVFGPMLSVKSISLMMTAFRPRVVMTMTAVAGELIFIGALLVNLRTALL